MTLTLPTGHVVTLQASGNGSAPDVVGGMSTNSSTLWCRLVRGDLDTGWRQCWDKSAIKVRQWWSLVESEADVAEVWAECTGEVLDV